MTSSNPQGKKIIGGTAPLRNIAILDSLVRRANERHDHLPGIICLSGPSGFGKSTAAAWLAAHHQAIYVEVRSIMTKKAFLESILRQMGLQPGRTVYDMLDQISQELACSQRMAIFDEFDNAVDRNLVELVRDIYEQSKTTILLIGEERLPQKLQKWERFSGRILDYAQAQAADLQDARALNGHYAPEITVADDLLQTLVDQARGIVRRIVTNLDRIAKFGRAEGLSIVDLADWGHRDLHTAAAPTPRGF